MMLQGRMQGVLSCSCFPNNKSLVRSPEEREVDWIILNLNTHSPRSDPVKKERDGAQGTSAQPQQSYCVKGAGCRGSLQTTGGNLSFGEVRVAGTHLPNSRFTRGRELGGKRASTWPQSLQIPEE